MSQTISNPYAVLGIPPGASEQQVRQAYRRLAMRYHPDLHPGTRASEQMRLVNQAWEILSSPLRRARYDAESMRSRSPSYGQPSYGHWSTSARSSSAGSQRSGPVAPAWTTQAATGAYPRPRILDEERPGWLTVIVIAVIGLLAFVVLFAGILPAPLFGITLLVIVRGIFARFD
jgi:hypothetical protein